MISRFVLALLIAGAALAPAAQKLLVVSVDGLDQRYLDRRDEMHLRIPNIRRMIREGQAAPGVMGIMPTITWPSHTTIISGVTPAVHGIRSNRLPLSEGGDYPWNAKLLKARTILDAAHDAGRKTASITWPVTVDAPVDFNLPEYFQRRRGGAMDLRSIGSKATPPDLVNRITAAFPSFPQEWMDDRTRTLATVWILQNEKPDLMLVHMVDLDSEAHDNGPFTREANAILEYTDELIGQMIRALPEGYALALVSDHGFEQVDQIVNLNVLAKENSVTGIQAMGAVVVARTPQAVSFIQQLAADKKYGIGRQIPVDELKRHSPELANAAGVWESAPGFQFGGGGPNGSSSEIFAKPHEVGNHGHWPTRYRSVYVLWGSGVKAGTLPELRLTDLAVRLAEVIGLKFQPGPRS